MPKNIGSIGEQFAQNHLQKKGWKILETNFHSRFGEIDIIAYDPNQKEIVFVEVKARSNTLFGTPGESITKSKFQKMLKTAQHYLVQKKKEDEPYRFDALCLEKKDKGFKVEHFENIYIE